MKKPQVYWFAAALLVGMPGASRASAHHNIAAAYFIDKEPVLHGKIATFLYRNPHSFLLVGAPDETGRMQQWSIEWNGGGPSGAQGIQPETLKAGDEVSITIMPGKKPEDHRGAVKILRRLSDGLEWGTKPGENESSWMLAWPYGGVK